MSVESPAGVFAERSAELGVEITRVTAEGAWAAIADALEPPAIGAPIPIDGIDVESIPELTMDPTPATIDAAQSGVTGAILGIAEYGSIVIEADAVGSEPNSLFVGHHVAVLAASDLAVDMGEAIERMSDLASDGADMIIATGPSATADMGELVLGAHGPASVDVVFVEDR